MTPSWPARDGLVEERRRLRRVVGEHRRHPPRPATRSSTASRSTSGASSRSSPSTWRQSKKRAGQQPTARGCRSGSSSPGSGRAARPSLVEAQGLAVEHQARGRGGVRTTSTIAGQAVGDVVEVAGEDADLVAVAVDLDAGAVELPLHRRRPAWPPGRRPRRASWPPAWAAPGCSGRSPTPASAAAPPPGSGQGQRGHVGQVAGQHGRPADVADGKAGGLGHRVEHHAFEGALAQLAGQRPAQEAASASVARPNRSARTALRAADRARPGGGRQPVHRAVDVGHGERRLRRRRGREPRPASPTRPRCDPGGPRRSAAPPWAPPPPAPAVGAARRGPPPSPSGKRWPPAGPTSPPDRRAGSTIPGATWTGR